MPDAVTSDIAAYRGSLHKSAVDEMNGHVITELTVDEYDAALVAGVANTHSAEPHVASAMPLINQFKQTAWMMMPLQMVVELSLQVCSMDARVSSDYAYALPSW